MAKLLNPLLSTDAKGTTTGLTFRNWRGLRNVTRKAAPVKRTIPQQNINRSLMGYLSRRWSTLTVSERASWLAWAQAHPRPDGFGGFFQMSSINAFTGMNHTAMRLGGGVGFNLLAPTVDLVNGIASFALTAGVNSGEITSDWTLWGTGLAGDFIEFQAAGPFTSAGKVEVQGKFKLITAQHGNIIHYVIAGLVPAQYYWIRIRYVQEDGQTSSWMYGQQLSHA